jgi:hypothetical protein
MITKHLIRPERVRRIPPGFNWVDHRLVRLDYINRCDCPALALYLLLVTVADVQGLSYYSDKALGRRLKLDIPQLVQARTQLEQADLIAYEPPLYQVLSIEEETSPLAPIGQRIGQVQSTAQILQRILAGGAV